MPSTELARDAINQSVQVLPDATQPGVASAWGETVPLLLFGRTPFLPPWGTRRRERTLRSLYRQELNTLFQGAVMGQAKKVASAPWEISGPKAGTPYFQDVFRGAHFGAGWRDFVLRVILDYSRHDIGAFIEIIGPGDPLGEIIGYPTGIAYLDALHCYPTGDPIYPVIYEDFDKKTRQWKRHIMHASRVRRLVDMPDGEKEALGTGLCALSRASAIVQREILMGRYVEYSLDDKPKPGILMLRNLTEQKWNEATARYLTAENKDDRGPFGKVVTLFGLQPENPIEANVVTFSEPPVGFDYKAYKVDIDVNEMALALGVDVQELWQLGSSGGRMGTSTQSEILNQKSRGKTFGDILKALERTLNDVLPTRYEFEFKWRDAQEDQEQATLAATWVGIAASLPWPDEYKNKLLANQVEAFRDVITDENGEIIRLDDADPKDPNQEVEDDVSGDDQSQMEEGQGQEPQEQASQDDTKARMLKQWTRTRSGFVGDLMDAIEAARNNTLDRRRFGTVMRAQLRRYGLDAYRDGLKDAGVDPNDMDTRDEAALQEWLRLQSEYVTKFANNVFTNGLSDAQVEAHAEMWANKSLRDAYQLGQASGAWNAPFMWVLGPTEEHCEDCARLAGQVHRMRDWRKKAYTPGASSLACGGYNCLCQLKPAPGKRASGRF